MSFHLEIETQTVFSAMDNKYAGMTVNERLYVSGLMDEFDDAVKKKNVERVRSILKEVDLSEGSIMPILEKLGL